MRHDQHLLLPCSCCVRERCGLFFLVFCISPRLRGVGFFLDFLYLPAFERCLPFFLFYVSPGGPKAPKSFQKTPRYRGKRPGASFFVFFHLQNRTVPGGVYSHYYAYDPETTACITKIAAEGALTPRGATVPRERSYSQLVARQSRPRQENSWRLRVDLAYVGESALSTGERELS